MGNVSAADLDRVTSFEQLVELLRDKLEWPIGEDYGFDDIVFEYEASELGLKKGETAKIREIHQLRPLATNQPWGIFFISMEDKAIPVTVLRRILKALVVKKRSGAQTADRRAWDKSDLIFAARFGKSGARELAFIHFSDGKTAGDLPVMKVLGWNAQDTRLHNEHVAKVLREKLIWPDDPEDAEHWRKTWASAFELRLNQVIKTSKDLAIRLADLASDIRARVNQLLEAEDEAGPMRTMHSAFRKNLIHDLDDDGFADMFAQTIAYGMLAARISRPMGIIADNLADMVPKTNPFLKELFGNFLKIGGRDKRTGLDFDELGIRDVVDLLNDADMEAVLRDFGDRNPKEDPVIHFYELFLKEYDPQRRMQRGVFYTPRPVVNFIVRGVDEILRTEFGLPLGLADTSTWAEVAARNDRIAIPAHVKPEAPFVQILDPATGTGTFLVEVIDLIHKRMEEHWRVEGKSAVEIKAAWNDYVSKHLLPRLTAFELMMAPYTIAHMKVGLKLTETGYAFGSNERALILLTNALEPARSLDLEERMRSPALAHEAEQANSSKVGAAYTVIVGNPPYSKSSQNQGQWIEQLMETYKTTVRRTETQIQALSDDYAKFIRYGQYSIESAGAGVLGLITNNGYLDGPLFRDMRSSMHSVFSEIFISNLHGDSRKLALPPDGQADENVFDIQQGVAIGIFTRTPGEVGSRCFSYQSIWGSRAERYAQLHSSYSIRSGFEETKPTKPHWLFIPLSIDRQAEFAAYWHLYDVFGTGDRQSDNHKCYGAGFVTQQDTFAIAHSVEELADNITDFLEPLASKEELWSRYKFCSTDQWNYDRAREELKNVDVEGKVACCLYRPFDWRFTLFDRNVCTIVRSRITSQFDGSPKCFGLLTTRRATRLPYNNVFVTVYPSEYKVASHDRNTIVFPLWIHCDRVEDGGMFNDDRRANFNPKFLSALSAQRVQVSDANWPEAAEHVATSESVFFYVYGILSSPAYRNRYGEFLMVDFAHVPIPKSPELFQSISELGERLVGFHLLHSEDLATNAPRFVGNVGATIEQITYSESIVWINKKAGYGFHGVPEEVWDFHIGGYPVCQKWLKDRRGRALSREDIAHYQKIVVALVETIRLMQEIDEVIEKHGGWPGAFYQPPPAAALG